MIVLRKHVFEEYTVGLIRTGTAQKMDPSYIWTWLILVLASLTAMWLFLKRTAKAISTNLSCGVILKTIQQSKLFPLSQEQRWCLIGQFYQHRLWHTKLKSQLHNDRLLQLDIYGSYSKVKGTAQNVLGALTDIAKYPEWRVSVREVSQISPNQSQLAPSGESTPETKAKSPPDATGVQYDVIRVHRVHIENVRGAQESWINTLTSWRRGNVMDRSYDVSRYWNKEDNGCCWMLEMTCHQDDWIFYLVQPVEKWFEIDQCLLTVIHFPGQTHSGFVSRLPAEILNAFQNYIMFRKIQCVPLTHLTVDDGLPWEAAGLPTGATSNPPLSKAKAFFDDIASRFAKDDAKPESMFIKRLKNLIEEKKGWYEERKRRASLKTKTKADMATDSSGVHNDQMQTDQWESDDEERSRSRGAVPSQLNDAASGIRTTPKDEGAVDKSNDRMSSSLRQRIKRRLWADRSRKSAESDSQTDEPVTNPDTDQDRPCQYSLDQINQGTENTLEAVYDEVGKETIAEILSVKSKISNIDIQLPYEQQAKRTGGWIYCGLEKEVVILRKLCNDGASVQSFLGKGLIACSPKQVFEALRNPKTRFTYDDMLKRMETLQEFDNGTKILYWYHEVSQMFKKVSRDFCVLQYEQIEGSKYVISLRSVKWPGCTEKDDTHRATLHASGWIIEAAPKDDKLHSMVTYIMQMELGRFKGNSGYLVEELAAKQPLGIAFLRQYLVPSSSGSRPLTPKDNRRSAPKDRDGGGERLSVLAAQYNKTQQRFDESEYKPILC